MISFNSNFECFSGWDVILKIFFCRVDEHCKYTNKRERYTETEITLGTLSEVNFKVHMDVP